MPSGTSTSLNSLESPGAHVIKSPLSQQCPTTTYDLESELDNCLDDSLVKNLIEC